MFISNLHKNRTAIKHYDVRGLWISDSPVFEFEFDFEFNCGS